VLVVIRVVVGVILVIGRKVSLGRPMYTFEDRPCVSINCRRCIHVRSTRKCISHAFAFGCSESRNQYTFPSRVEVNIPYNPPSYHL
jgi:hypothetical protein